MNTGLCAGTAALFSVVVFSAAVIRDGKSVGFRGIIMDITERKLIEEQLEQTTRPAIPDTPRPWQWYRLTPGQGRRMEPGSGADFRMDRGGGDRTFNPIVAEDKIEEFSC